MKTARDQLLDVVDFVGMRGQLMSDTIVNIDGQNGLDILACILDMRAVAIAEQLSLVSLWEPATRTERTVITTARLQLHKLELVCDDAARIFGEGADAEPILVAVAAEVMAVRGMRGEVERMVADMSARTN